MSIFFSVESGLVFQFELLEKKLIYELAANGVFSIKKSTYVVKTYYYYQMTQFPSLNF